MSWITEQRHTAGFLVSEALPGYRSRGTGTLAEQSAVTEAGTILGKYIASADAPTYAAASGNTGDFSSSDVTASAGVKVGTYSLVFYAATLFSVFDPDGLFVGSGVVGTAFSAGGLSFTLTAGDTASVAGDGATITVAAHASAGNYAPLDLSATTGLQTAAAILFATVDATSGDSDVTLITREAEVNGDELVWPDDVTTDQKTAITETLATLGIFLR